MEERIIRAIRRIAPTKHVYNVRVANNHNYFANGILTHNCDDPNALNDTSDAGLETVQQFWEDVMPTRLNDARTGRRIIVQQRAHEKDLTGIITRNKDHGFVTLVLPMEFEPDRRSVTVVLPSTAPKKWQDPRTKEGELLWPERIGPVELKKLKKELRTSYNISGQLQQRPAPGEGGIIKRKWFRIWPEARPPKCYYIVQSWDTAMSEKKEAAYNACSTWGVFKDEHEVPNIILLAAWRRQCEYPELRKHAIRMSSNYLDDGDLRFPQKPANPAMKPHLLLIEDKSSGKTLIQDLRRASIMATPFNPDKLGDKTQRVRMVTPILEGGRVWVPGIGPDYKAMRTFADRFVEQSVSFPKAASRDWVDTMTQALWRLESSGWVYHPDDEPPPPENGPTGKQEELY